MLLFFIIFVIFIINIQFLIRNIFFDVDSVQFFMFNNTYPFTKDMAEETLLFVFVCTIALCVGYWFSSSCISYRRNRVRMYVVRSVSEFSLAINMISIFLLIQIIAAAYVIFDSGFSYVAINESKRNFNFIFELRMLPLLLLSYVCLNLNPKTWFGERKLILPMTLLVIYIVLSISLQARSVVFQVVAILMFCWLAWNGNKIKIKYILLLCCALIIPNILILFRFFGSGLLSLDYIAGNLFTIEYSVIFNNILSGVILSDSDPLWGESFIPNLMLVVPSPLRELLDIGSGSTDVYSTIGKNSGVLGGGFSLFAEMYLNFKWWSIFGFVIFGLFLGKITTGALFHLSRANILNAAAPLVYISFVLLLRNDLGVFMKYVIQLYIMCVIIYPVIKKRNYL